jgi:hypothetical protein
MAQAVSRRLPVAATTIRSDIRPCAICGGRKGNGTGFLPVLRLRLPLIIQPAAPHSLLILSLTLYSHDTDSVVKQPT